MRLPVLPLLSSVMNFTQPVSDGENDWLTIPGPLHIHEV